MKNHGKAIEFQTQKGVKTIFGWCGALVYTPSAPPKGYICSPCSSPHVIVMLPSLVYMALLASKVLGLVFMFVVYTYVLVIHLSRTSIHHLSSYDAIISSAYV
jgi:hypothetical protein